MDKYKPRKVYINDTPNGTLDTFLQYPYQPFYHKFRGLVSPIHIAIRDHDFSPLMFRERYSAFCSFCKCLGYIFAFYLDRATKRSGARALASHPHAFFVPRAVRATTTSSSSSSFALPSARSSPSMSTTLSSVFAKPSLVHPETGHDTRDVQRSEPRACDAVSGQQQSSDRQSTSTRESHVSSRKWKRHRRNISDESFERKSKNDASVTGANVDDCNVSETTRCHDPSIVVSVASARSSSKKRCSRRAKAATSRSSLVRRSSQSLSPPPPLVRSRVVIAVNGLAAEATPSPAPSSSVTITRAVTSVRQSGSSVNRRCHRQRRDQSRRSSRENERPWRHERLSHATPRDSSGERAAMPLSGTGSRGRHVSSSSFAEPLSTLAAATIQSTRQTQCSAKRVGGSCERERVRGRKRLREYEGSRERLRARECERDRERERVHKRARERDEATHQRDSGDTVASVTATRRDFGYFNQSRRRSDYSLQRLAMDHRDARPRQCHRDYTAVY